MSHVERRLRARKADLSLEFGVDVVAMQCAIQLRVCNADSMAKAIVRNTKRIGGKAGKLEVQLEWVVGRGRQRVSLSGEMASRNLVRSDGSGAVIWRVVVRCCTAWVDVGGLMGQERAQLVVVLFEYLALADSF